MPHLDEGTLHALLDGELETAEVKEIQTHLGSCAACGSRLQDVKQFLAESDRLVEALAMPGGTPKAGREPAPPPEASSTPSNAQPWREPVWDSPPELLLPEDPEGEVRRRRWNSRFRWAAMILIFLGAGQVVKSIVTSGDSGLPTDERDMISSAPPSIPPVVSPEEQVRAEPPLTKQSRPSTPASRTRAPKPAAEPKLLADRPAPDTAATDQSDTLVMAAQEDIPASPPPEVGAAARPDTEGAARRDPSADVATRQAAAAALEELDRERLRSRANAATAALPPPSPDPPVATVEPAARTLEQKSQIYLRIGLDEAAQQLGRPMHVIEAMSPEFVGLAQGRQVAGADPNRPVVRVVYRDSRGRMILLDQQRLRTGQAPGAASGNLRWTLGDVMLYLHGEPGPEALRTLQRRVR